MPSRLPSLRDERGFTLTELLVVILIVGVLAAIAVPAFLGQRHRSEDSIAKTTARAATRAMIVYSQDHDDAYDCGDTASCLTAVRNIEDAVPTAGVSFADLGGSGNPSRNAFRVTVLGGEGRTFWIDHSDSSTVRGCALNGASSQGSCNGGSW